MQKFIIFFLWILIACNHNKEIDSLNMKSNIGNINTRNEKNNLASNDIISINQKRKSIFSINCKTKYAISIIFLLVFYVCIYIYYNHQIYIENNNDILNNIKEYRSTYKVKNQINDFDFNFKNKSLLNFMPNRYEKYKDNINKFPVFKFSKSKFPFLIFQIGFNKCGTTSLYEFFNLNQIPGIHWMVKKKRLANIMFDNYMNNKLVLGKLPIKKFMYFGDFEVFIKDGYFNFNFLNITFKYGAYREWYKILNIEYPNSKYILNIRNYQHWLNSRYNHENGMYFLDSNFSDIYIIRKFKNIWYQYICELLFFFKTNDIYNNLIIFDVENDSPKKLVSFFKKFNITLNHTLYSQANKTPQKKRRSKKLANLTITYPKFFNDINESITEYERIISKCNLPFSLE